MDTIELYRFKVLDPITGAHASFLVQGHERSPAKYASHIETEGEALYEQVSELGLEGIVCKRADSRYVAGPSRDWLKVKTAAGKQVDDERLRHLRA